MSATTTTNRTAATGPDPDRVEAFAGELFGLYTGAMLTYLVHIGHRTGLFAAAEAGPATCPGLADRAGLEERYVREWLAAMVTGGIVEHDPVTGTFSLPAEHAACLVGDGGDNLAPYAALPTHLATHVAAVARAFRDGGGVPYETFRPEFTDVMDALGRGGFDEHLLEWVDLEPGVTDRLREGVRVADVGCGTGHALVLLGVAFPASTFVGYDLSDEAIARARAEAGAAGLDNVGFEVADAARLTVDDPFDVVVVFDAVHDQVDPAGMLGAIAAMLRPDGVLLAFEPHASSDFADNVGHPLAPFLYATSTLHCMTVSLAHGGAGLGTMWGEQVARRLLTEAGLGQIRVREVPDDPVNALYVARHSVPGVRPAGTAGSGR